MGEMNPDYSEEWDEWYEDTNDPNMRECWRGLLEKCYKLPSKEKDEKGG